MQSEDTYGLFFKFSWSIFLFLYSTRVALQFRVLLIDQILPFSSSSETRCFSPSPITTVVFWLAAPYKHIWTAGVRACSGIESTVQILNWISGRGWMLTWAFESLAMFNMSSHHDNSTKEKHSEGRALLNSGIISIPLRPPPAWSTFLFAANKHALEVMKFSGSSSEPFGPKAP